MGKIFQLVNHRKGNTNGEYWKCTQTQLQLRKYKLKPKLKTIIYLSALKKLKSLTIKSTVKDMKQVESFIVSENIHWYNQFGSQFGIIP